MFRLTMSAHISTITKLKEKVANLTCYVEICCMLDEMSVFYSVKKRTITKITQLNNRLVKNTAQYRTRHKGTHRRSRAELRP